MTNNAIRSYIYAQSVLIKGNGSKNAILNGSIEMMTETMIKMKALANSAPTRRSFTVWLQSFDVTPLFAHSLSLSSAHKQNIRYTGTLRKFAPRKDGLFRWSFSSFQINNFQRPEIPQNHYVRVSVWRSYGFFTFPLCHAAIVLDYVPKIVFGKWWSTESVSMESHWE